MSVGVFQAHGLINYVETPQAKCCHLQKLTCKWTLRPVFIRVYRMEIQSVMLVFSTQLCELLPHLSLFPVWISILYTRIQCVRGGYGVLDLSQINTCRRLPLQVNFLDEDILHCLLWVLSFYGHKRENPGLICEYQSPGKLCESVAWVNHRVG